MTRKDHPAINVAYLTNYYPAPTHTFIRNEILGLQKLGCAVHRYSHHRAETLVEPLDLLEQALTHNLCGRFLGRAISSVAVSFARRPLRAIKTLVCAIRIGRAGERRVSSSIGHFMLACTLSEQLAKVGDPHLHAHLSISPTDVAYLCSRLRGLRYSFTLHATYEYEDCDRLSLREKIGAAEFVVTVSEHGRDYLTNRFPGFRNKIKHIPCGLADDWMNTRYRSVAATRNLVSVARLEKQKDLELLLRSLAIVKTQGTPFKLAIAGDGSMRVRLEFLISELHLQEDVVLLGWRTQDQLQRLIENADALVLTSDSEGIPMAILEAAALARPAIATDVGGVGEVVETGATGWLVPRQNCAALVRVLTDCLSKSRADLQRLGENARTRVLSRSSARSAAMLKQLFVSVQAVEGGTE